MHALEWLLVAHGDHLPRMDAIEEGTSFLLEREIRGDFEKFSSNSGWCSGVDPILEAFSHWTWCHTKKKTGAWQAPKKKKNLHTYTHIRIERYIQVGTMGRRPGF